MQPKSLLIVFPVLLVLFLFQENMNAQYRLGTWVSGSGGGTVSGDTYTVVSTLGQSLSGVAQYNGFSIQSGFMHAAIESTITGIEHPDVFTLQQFILGQNYPNPFTWITAIEYEVAEIIHVEIIVYNTFGQAISILVSEDHYPGRYKVIFNPGAFPGGVYFYRMKAGDFLDTRKMLLLR